MRTLVLLAVCTLALGSPLDDYVNTWDPTYNWTILNHTYNFDVAKTYFLNVTSQTWLTPSDSNRAVWWHYMAVTIPKTLSPKHVGKAAIYVTGGDNTDGIPGETSEDILVSLALAAGTGTPTVTLWQIPNQPITFPSDPTHQGRSEDALVAFTWRHVLDYPTDPYWFVLLPMVKAVVAAMNATEQYAQQEHNLPINEWIVAGASKRGWTTWLTGAVQAVTQKPKVIGIAPIVFDALNLQQNLHHMWRNYGGWTFAFQDYYHENLTAMIDVPSFSTFASVGDPYSYLDRYTNMPKLVVDATDDEFFQMDDNYLWVGNMTGELHLLMAQNSEHSMITGIPEVLPGIIAFATAVMENVPRPNFSWTIGDDGTLTVTDDSATKAHRVRLRYAENFNPARKDFRWLAAQPTPNHCPTPEIPVKGYCFVPILWLGENLNATSGNTYVAHRPAPTNGKWGAYFIEMYYLSPSFVEYRFTTQVVIQPYGKYPFSPCAGAACKGTII